MAGEGEGGKKGGIAIPGGRSGGIAVGGKSTPAPGGADKKGGIAISGGRPGGIVVGGSKPAPAPVQEGAARGPRPRIPSEPAVDQTATFGGVSLKLLPIKIEVLKELDTWRRQTTHFHEILGLEDPTVLGRLGDADAVRLAEWVLGFLGKQEEGGYITKNTRAEHSRFDGWCKLWERVNQASGSPSPAAVLRSCVRDYMEKHRRELVLVRIDTFVEDGDLTDDEHGQLVERAKMFGVEANRAEAFVESLYGEWRERRGRDFKDLRGKKASRAGEPSLVDRLLDEAHRKAKRIESGRFLPSEELLGLDPEEASTADDDRVRQAVNKHRVEHEAIAKRFPDEVKKLRRAHRAYAAALDTIEVLAATPAPAQRLREIVALEIAARSAVVAPRQTAPPPEPELTPEYVAPTVPLDRPPSFVRWVTGGALVGAACFLLVGATCSGALGSRGLSALAAARREHFPTSSPAELSLVCGDPVGVQREAARIDASWKETLRAERSPEKARSLEARWNDECVHMSTPVQLSAEPPPAPASADATATATARPPPAGPVPPPAKPAASGDIIRTSPY